jgi:signal transduction histidine kinase
MAARAGREETGSVTTDARLQRLLDAVLSFADDLELTSVLERIVVAACTLVDARYGALGVLDVDGPGLSAFVHHGVDDATAREVGHLPEGHGVLGVLIEDPVPLRLDDLADHERSYGFPAGHPAMHTFLGTPIRVRDEVFGNLYLTEKRGGGGFTAHDEELIVGLAAVAGAAIQNARLYDEARRRDRWRDAVLEVAGTVLAGGSAPIVRERVASLGLELVEGDGACVIEPHDGGLWVLASSGRRGPPIGFLAAGFDRTWAELDAAMPIRVDAGLLFAGPSLWVPIRDGERTVAALGVGRAGTFVAREEALLATFAAQVSLAWTHERAQTDLQRLRVVEDRERIGRDLHDTVIQRLFATGLSLQGSVRRSEGQPEVVARLERAVDDIDEIIKEIRATIFALQSTSGSPRGVRSGIMDVIDEVTPALSRSPRVRFDGPIDAVVDDDVLDQLLPMLREALTNVAKHAEAVDVEVELTVDQTGLLLRVRDDGRGIDPDAPRGFGLANLAERAAAVGGQLTIGSGRDGRGTALVLRIPEDRRVVADQ